MPSAPTIARRFALWLAICAVSAAPSFVLALALKASVAGMIAAVLAFAVLYTIVTCTERFERFHRRPFVRATLYVGYGLRVAATLLSATAVLGRGAMPLGFLIFPDMMGGMLSVRVVGFLFGDPGGEGAVHTFAGAFLTTCVQGALLNVVVFIVMAIAYGLQRAFRKPPPDHSPRGFDVVPIAELRPEHE